MSVEAQTEQPVPWWCGGALSLDLGSCCMMDDVIELRKDNRSYEMRRSNISARNIGLVFGVSGFLFVLQYYSKLH